MGRPVTHWQILAKDPDRLADFYSKLFAWKVQSDNALGYRTVDPGTDRGIAGGEGLSEMFGHRAGRAGEAQESGLARPAWPRRVEGTDGANRLSATVSGY